MVNFRNLINKNMNKFKNIITNLIGIAFFGIAIHESLSDERNLTFIFSFLLIGVILFRYKFSETKAYINRLLNKAIDDGDKVDIVANTVDPDREYPDERG